MKTYKLNLDDVTQICLRGKWLDVTRGTLHVANVWFDTFGPNSRFVWKIGDHFLSCHVDEVIGFNGGINGEEESPPKRPLPPPTPCPGPLRKY